MKRLDFTRRLPPHPSMAVPGCAALETDAAVVIFARLPIPGKAKTRLAAAVGPENAAEFYRRMAERTFDATAQCARVSSRTLFFSESSESEAIAGWMKQVPGCKGMRTSSQCESKDLGDRMRHALNHALAFGGPDGGACDRAIVVGTDIPDLDAGHVDGAVRLLERHDVVFGPAVDGGYYLLGVRRRRRGAGAGNGDKGRMTDGAAATATATGTDTGLLGMGLGAEAGVVSGDEDGAPPALFTDIPWSTGTVLADSVAAARRVGLSVAPVQTIRDVGLNNHGEGHEDFNSVGLPVLQDIDTMEDLAAWMGSIEDTSETAMSAAGGGAAGAEPRQPHLLQAAANCLLSGAGLLRSAVTR